MLSMRNNMFLSKVVIDEDEEGHLSSPPDDTLLHDTSQMTQQ